MAVVRVIFVSDHYLQAVHMASPEIMTEYHRRLEAFSF